MNDAHPQGDPAELAALYVAGGMSELERWGFERHLGDRCATCAAEMTRLNAASQSLAEFSEHVAPAERIKLSLLQRIAASPTVTPADKAPEQVWRKWRSDSSDNLCTLRANEGGWEKTGVEGVSIRRLFVDSDRNQFTGMVRMAAGASYPRHVHNGAEECLVLEGDLHVGDLVLHPGDYQRAPAGSLHGVQSTEGGCLLLITSSLHDYFV